MTESVAVVVVTLMWPFLFTTGSPDDDPRRWWTLALFAVFAVLFFRWEHRYAQSGRAPLIPLGLFSVASFRNGTLIAAWPARWAPKAGWEAKRKCPAWPARGKTSPTTSTPWPRT